MQLTLSGSVRATATSQQIHCEASCHKSLLHNDRAIVPEMSRATIIVDVTPPEEVTVSEAWFTKWAGSLTFRSEDEGCGCCVHIWNVEGADEALAALPPNIKGRSSWADSERGESGSR